MSADTKKEKNYRWYIVTCSSSKEKTTAKLIMQKVKANNLEEEVIEVVVPTQEKVVVVKGKKKTVEDRIFPGYILIKMELNDSSMMLIRNTEGVQGFVGMSATSRFPTPLSEREAKGILAYTQIKQDPIFEAQFNVGEAVKVIDGPFKEFIGTVQSINASKQQVKVLLTLFESETPVDLDFAQVSKISSGN